MSRAFYLGNNMLALHIGNENNTQMKFFRRNGKFFINMYNPSLAKYTCIELSEDQMYLLMKTMQFFCSDMMKDKKD